MMHKNYSNVYLNFKDCPTNELFAITFSCYYDKIAATVIYMIQYRIKWG